MGLFGSRETALEASRRRAAATTGILSPAPGTGTGPVDLSQAPNTGRARSAATLLALTAAKRQRKKAQVSGFGATPTGKPISVGHPLSAIPKTLVGY